MVRRGFYFWGISMWKECWFHTEAEQWGRTFRKTVCFQTWASQIVRAAITKTSIFLRFAIPLYILYSLSLAMERRRRQRQYLRHCLKITAQITGFPVALSCSCCTVLHCVNTCPATRRSSEKGGGGSNLLRKNRPAGYYLLFGFGYCFESSVLFRHVR